MAFAIRDLNFKKHEWFNDFMFQRPFPLLNMIFKVKPKNSKLTNTCVLCWSLSYTLPVEYQIS